MIYYGLGDSKGNDFCVHGFVDIDGPVILGNLLLDIAFLRINYDIMV